MEIAKPKSGFYARALPRDQVVFVDFGDNCCGRPMM
jgi:hypothetical protein